VRFRDCVVPEVGKFSEGGIVFAILRVPLGVEFGNQFLWRRQTIGPHEDRFDLPISLKYAVAAKAAQSAGLGVNAGHDLNLQNLGKFCEIPGILEVSIGHALVADALEMGMIDAVQAYLRVLTAAIRE
jgi:hypothetical protein